MKTFSLLVVVCLVSAASAGAQVNAVAMSAPMQGLSFSEHALHASPSALATEQSLIGHSAAGYAQGERPLWEVMPLAPETPLGDLARSARKDHEGAKKAVKIWTN